MTIRWSAAGLLATLTIALPLLGFASRAGAADLDDGPPPDVYQRYGSAYDDPRYRDLYGPERGPPPYAAPRYAERYEPQPPPTYYPRGSYKDGEHYGRYLAPMPPPSRFVPERRFSQHDCVPRHVVKDRLRAQGWNDFHEPSLDGSLARVKARRPSGRLFVLEVDRCSGEIVNAERIGEAWSRPYAYTPYARPRGSYRTY